MCVLWERSSGLNLPSIKDLACSQRGVIRGRGPLLLRKKFHIRTSLLRCQKIKGSLLKGLFAIPHDWSCSSTPLQPPSLFHTPATDAKPVPLSLPLTLSLSLSIFLFTASLRSVFVYLHVNVSCVSLSLRFLSSSIPPTLPFSFVMRGSPFSPAAAPESPLPRDYFFSFMLTFLRFFFFFSCLIVSVRGQRSFAPASRRAWGTFLI